MHNVLAISRRGCPSHPDLVVGQSICESSVPKPLAVSVTPREKCGGARSGPWAGDYEPAALPRHRDPARIQGLRGAGGVVGACMVKYGVRVEEHRLLYCFHFSLTIP